MNYVFCEQIAPGVFRFGPRGKNRTGDGDVSNYSYHKKIVQPLRTSAGKSETNPRETLAKMCFEAWAGHVLDYHHQLAGLTWETLPDADKAGWLAAVKPVVKIMEKRERGFVWLLEVLHRYCDKIDLLKNEIKEARRVAKGLLAGLTKD